MSRNELRPLRVAVEQALHATRVARLSSPASAIERRLRAGGSWTALALAPVLVLALPQSAAAQNAWTGSASNDWMNASNWSPGTLPAGDVTINTNAPNPTVLGVSSPATATIGHLSLGTTAGTSTLTIRNGSSLSSNIATGSDYIGRAAASNATVTVTGRNSTWSTANSLAIGAANTATGTLNIFDRAAVNIANNINLGQTAGNGTVNIASGGALTTGNATMGQANSAGTANISGPGSQWSVGGYLRVGAGTNGTGVLTVDNGGAVMATSDINIGGPTASTRGTGTATITGAGSRLISGGVLNVGGAGTGTLTVSDGAVATANTVVIAASISGLQTGRGTFNLLSGSALQTQALTGGPGVMRQVNFDNSTLRATASNAAFITGFSGTELNIAAGGLTLDTAGFDVTAASPFSGTGALTKVGEGTLALSGDNTYTGGTTIAGGTLQIGAGGASGSLTGNITNEGTLAFNRSDAMTFDNVISGSGAVTQLGSGTTVLTSEQAYTGVTTISAGTLALSGAGSITASSGLVNDGVFDISATDSGASITALSGSGSVVLGSKALTLTGPTSLFAGVIDGASGTLNKAGTGIWTFAGAGSQVGTLNLQAGTLELANGASLAAQNTTIAAGTTLRSEGALTGSMGNDTLALVGTLIGNMSFLDGDDHVQVVEGADFSQAGFDGGAGADTLELTYGGAFSLQNAPATTNFEHLIKRGNGTFTLSGTVDTFTDSITVAEGSVQLSGANVVTNEFRIEAGVTVKGTGSLSGSFINAGVLSPGNSPGAIHIGGNFTQSAGGTLVSEITRAGTDLLDISGAANLGGTHRINVEYGLYLDGTTHALIQAAGGMNGDFSSVEMNASALMTAQRELSANALSVSFARQPITSVTDPNSGRGRFATWLEEQISAGGLTQEMTDYIDTLIQQSTVEGVKSLLGERGQPVATVSQNSISILGAGFARTVFERFTLSDVAQCSPTQQGSSDALNCFWGHGLREWGQAGGDSRYDWTSDGGQIGVDRSLSSTWAIGATFGYADTGIRDLSGGHNEVRSKIAGLYANYNPGRLSLGAMAFYGGNDNSTRRNVLVGASSQQARADFDTDSYGAGIRLSYRVTSEAGPLVRPFIEAFYDHIDGAEFSERDAGEGNLSGRVHGRDGLRGTLGLQLADNFEGYGQVFRPALEVGVAHQFEDDRSTLDLQPFSNMPAFRTSGPALDRTAYIARASLNVSLGANASMALGYGGEFADDYSQHGGNLSFHMAW